METKRLVLKRKKGEVLLIGNARVIVDRPVKVIVEAPADVKVLRGELKGRAA
jgi:sRNA-binding carbon storage regulator CsrA